MWRRPCEHPRWAPPPASGSARIRHRAAVVHSEDATQRPRQTASAWPGGGAAGTWPTAPTCCCSWTAAPASNSSCCRYRRRTTLWCAVCGWVGGVGGQAGPLPPRPSCHRRAWRSAHSTPPGLRASSQVSCGMAMDKFLVYCKLMRAGYIVQRCARACCNRLGCCMPSPARRGPPRLAGVTAQRTATSEDPGAVRPCSGPCVRASWHMTATRCHADTLLTGSSSHSTTRATSGTCGGTILPVPHQAAP
jgi:hypothetical protein